jgi:4-amino-4-deoxy-L-arabinose transferase-like glycosyltransferase
MGLDVWWRFRETRPPHWDMARQLWSTLVFQDWFSLSHPLHFIDGWILYPPLTYWVTDAFYALAGSDAMWVAVLSNVVWLSILVFATYGIGRRLWSPRVGWLSVVFVVCSPMVVSAFKEYMLDMPLTAVSALALYLLIRAERFSSRRFALLFGIACGCGLLVKWTFPLVLALPTVHAFAGALHDARHRGRPAGLLNAVGAGVVAFAIAGTWYVHNFRTIIHYLPYDATGQGKVEGDPPIASLASAFWYVWALVNSQLYLLPFLFLLVGVTFAFTRRNFAARNTYPILLLIGTLVFFTLLRNKDPRYTMPMLPAAAVVATSWLECLRAKVRTAGTALLATYGALAFATVSFGTALLPKTIQASLPATSAPGTLVVFAQHGYLIGPPTDERWHQEDLFTTMAKFPASERTFAYRGPDTIWFNHWGFAYYALRYGARRTPAQRAAFLVARGERKGTPGGFVRLRDWRLPDGGSLALFRRASGAF